MSKKRLLHGMKRPLALFLALAMALAFVPVVTPTALAAGETLFTDAEITAVSYFTNSSTIVSKKHDNGANGWNVKDGELSISLENLLNGDKTPYAFLEIDLTTFFTVTGVVDGISANNKGFKYVVNKTFGGVTAETEYGLWEMTAGSPESAYKGTWYGDYDRRTTDKADFPTTTPSSYDGYIVKGTDSKYWLYVPTDLGSATYTITGDGGTVYTLTITVKLDYEITLSDTELSGKPVSSTLFSEALITIGTLGSFADSTNIWDTKNIADAATAKFNAGYKVTGVSTAKNAALVFKVVDSKGKDVSTSTSLIAVDQADTSINKLWPTTLWNVLNDKAYIGTSGEGEYNADLSAKMTDLGYTGYWGPAAGRDLADKTSSGFYKYPATGEYDFYFFAEKEDTYTITVGLIDAELGVLATDSVEIEVTNAPSLDKTVTIGDMSDPVIIGNASGSKYDVVTEDIADYTPGTITWYDGTSTTTSLPIGLDATLTSLIDNAAKLTVTADATAAADTYGFTVTYDGVESAVKTLTVVAAPSTSATVTSLPELTDALSGGKTDITVYGVDGVKITLTDDTVIPADTTLTIADDNTLSVYGGLTLGAGAKVKIQGTLELSVYTLANLTAGTGAGFAFDGGTLKLIANQNATGRLAGLFADADFDLGLYAGAVLNLAGSYGNVDFDWLLSLFSGSGLGAIAITDGVCGVVNNNVTLPGNMTLDVQDGAALQIEDGATLTVANGAELTVNGTLDVSGKVTAESGAKVSLQSDITIAAGGSLDLLNATLTTGTIIITLQQGADLNVPAGSGTFVDLTVKDYAGNTLPNDGSGNYSVPDFAPIVITSESGGLGDSFNIAVTGGINSSDLYLIVQFVKGGTVSLAMIAVGAYNHNDGYETYVSCNDADQVTVWLVYEENVTTIPVWTEPDTGAYLADATYPVPVVTP